MNKAVQKEKNSAIAKNLASKNNVVKALSHLGREGARIILKSPKNLTPYPNNPRIHDERQLDMLIASFKELGMLQPILVDEEYVVLAGHGRLAAAIKGGYKLVPVIKVKGLSKAQKKAAVIADNKLAEKSKWSDADLSILFEELTAMDYSPELTGFSTAEIDSIVDHLEVSEVSDPAEIAEEDFAVDPVTRPGDVWCLGKYHRLVCGSALEDASYKLLMKGKLAQMIISDPPYNVVIDGHARGKGKSKHSEFLMASGEMSKTQFTDFLEQAMRLMFSNSIDGSIHFLFMDWRHLSEMMKSTSSVYGELKQLVVWNKDNGGMGSFYRSKHELLFVLKKGLATHINNFGLGENGRYRTNVWDCPGVNTMKKGRQDELDMHPTVKPLSLIADAIRDCSRKNGIILDPFCGSGTTIMAAERTGRKAYCMELDPKYVDVAITRFRRVTGEEVYLEKGGKDYDAVAARRLKTGGIPV